MLVTHGEAAKRGCRERVGQASGTLSQPGNKQPREILLSQAVFRWHGLGQGKCLGLEKSAHHPGPGRAVSSFTPRGCTLQHGCRAKTFCLGDQACAMNCWLRQTPTWNAAEVGLGSPETDLPVQRLLAVGYVIQALLTIIRN